MPLSWAKAFLPTIALFGWTWKPETVATRREIAYARERNKPVTFLEPTLDM